jgi:methyl-accepting chemotaxis protein
MLGFRRRSKSNPERVFNALDKSIAIIEFDPQGAILAANRLFCELIGYVESEIVGKPQSIFFERDYANSAAYKEFWVKLGRGELDRRENLHIGNGGKQIWINASYQPVLDARGKVASVVMVATETTATRLMNVTLEAKLAAISRGQAIIEFTPGGEIVDANENFLALLGYQLDEIKGRHHRMFVDAAYAHSVEYSDFWRTLGSGKFVSGEFERIGKSGRPVWIQASYNPISGLNGEIASIVKFATDVTGRVRAVTDVANGLAELAGNNITHRLNQPFDPAFEKLRSDYNASLEGLDDTISRVAVSAATVNTGSQEIAISTNGLSRRIEQQAASLEETATALDQITATVQQSAERALQAALAAAGARSGTDQSGKVMSQAAAAMSEINNSSQKITQIIGVMDEIAFQTNLLALNAGIEAARAGDAGKGFAVVAQEVRGLAQRSAVAAREIKALIASSSEEVERGVKLVSETVAALDGVTHKVGQIDSLLSEMATSAQEQATGLGEVNVAVNKMDEVTQQNAAMIELATVAASRLKGEAAELASLIGRFHSSHEQTEPAHSTPPPIATSGRSQRDIQRPRLVKA